VGEQLEEPEELEQLLERPWLDIVVLIHSATGS